MISTPWQNYQTTSKGGIRYRVACSLEDAKRIKAVLHSAWLVGQNEEYFYSSFNDPETIFVEFIKPSTLSDNIRSLPALCLVAEDAEAGIIGTASLIFDHVRRKVESGRGAVLHEAKGKKILLGFVELARQFLQLVPEYALIADTTTLFRSAGTYVEQLGASAISLHPSSFTIPKSCVNEWRENLATYYGVKVADALIVKSDATELGRFTTVYHLAMPKGHPVSKPVLTEQQHSFYEYAKKTLRVKNETVEQCPSRREYKVVDLGHTDTRLIFDPPFDAEPDAIIESALRKKIETIIIQVSCDKPHHNLSIKLEKAGALLGGVFPDTSCFWFASYTLFTTRKHQQKTLDSLNLLNEYKGIADSYMPLLGLMISQDSCGKG